MAIDRFGLVTASKILGHASIQMTMRYAHPTPENMHRAVSMIGKIFAENHRREIDNIKIRMEKNLTPHFYLANFIS